MNQFDVMSPVTLLYQRLAALWYGFAQIHAETGRWFAVQPWVSGFGRHYRQQLWLTRVTFLYVTAELPFCPAMVTDTACFV